MTKISFIIITARDNYPYSGRPELHLFEPMIESLKNQTMDKNDFELIIVDVLYNERKDYFKTGPCPFKVKHIPSAPNLWHEQGLVGVCTQYNKGIIYADGELIFFTGDSYMFVPEFCENLWKHHKEGYIPLAWYFYDNTFIPENKIINPEEAALSLLSGVSYNMSGYTGKNVNIESIDHRPLLVFRDSVSFHNSTWEWWFGCSGAPLSAMLKINGFNQKFDGDRMLLDCDVGSRLELAGYNKFGLFKDLFIVRAQNVIRTWSPKAGLNGGITIKCNYPLIHWSRHHNQYRANDHENIDEDIKWCKEVYCSKMCPLHDSCMNNYHWQYPFEHKAGYGYNCDKKWFEFWRTHQIKIDLNEERNKRIAGDANSEGFT